MSQQINGFRNRHGGGTKNPAGQGRGIQENAMQADLDHTRSSVPGAMGAMWPGVRKETPSQWLASRMMLGRDSRFCEIVDVTPELAAEMMKGNTHNRPIVAAGVAEYANLMAAGLWRLTTEGICFASDGVLINGQHRLLAIEKTGVSVKMTLWFGCDREEFRVVDAGRKRTAAQILSIAEVPNAAIRAALAGVILLMRGGIRTGQYGSQHAAAMAQEMERIGPVEAACTAATSLSRITSPTAAALAYWHISTTAPSRRRLGEFLDGLATGEQLTGPRLQLREWLMNGPLARSNGQTASVKRAAAFVLAWNGWLAGRKRVQTFDWPHFSTLPEAR